MKMIEGGISIPSVPPAASDPKKRRSPYPCRFISGIDTVPIVAAVATLDPEVAAKSAQAPMLACIVPPGSQDSHSTSAAYIRSATPERTSISPRSTKNGIATSVSEAMLCQATSPSIRSSGMGVKKMASRKESKPSAAATETERASSDKSSTRLTVIISGAPIRPRLRRRAP